MLEMKPVLSVLQMQAVEHIRGPALVVAGPGSGKTTVIVQRILYLIRNAGISPEQILVITYTKAAAQEMQQRFEKAWQKTGASQTTSVHFGTFHSICYHILQQFGSVSANSLIKESDRRTLVEILIKNMGLGQLCTYERISMILNAISYEKNQLSRKLCEQQMAPRLSAIPLSIDEYRRLKRAYDDYLRTEGLLDFEDMIEQCYFLLSSDQAVRKACQKLFSYILVDEFQDINAIQFEVLRLLALPQNHLFVVGDDDQSVYAFRGAAPETIKLFQKTYPMHQLLMLTENYRSGDNIVRLATRVIERGIQRFDKQFIPLRCGGEICVNCFSGRAEQEQAILEKLSVMQISELVQTAIIVRNNFDVIRYKQLLQDAKIPIAGTYTAPDELVKSFVFQDIMAFFDFLYGEGKRSDFLKFMNKPNHFFSRMALDKESITEEGLLLYYRNNEEMQRTVKNYFSQLEMAKRLSPGLALSLFRRVMGYDDYLREKATDERELRLWMEQLTRLEKMSSHMQGSRKLSSQLTRKAAEQSRAASDISREGIHVITMHGAKGLEFDRVFLPDVNEGIIPGRQCTTPEAIEEERRLLYVAITRARNYLYLSYTRDRGRKLSRYLEGLVTPSAPL